ncbi:MAG: glycosyltransferase family 4 protein [Cellvibrionales bacterium]|jgi:UDP-N-acetylmuramyl pentapeptide phosphotransferase/UDP-N-acetylglucosamine-1-phosphate transferase|nr:glycosyltransferase family 4 protein [Cellvibrionales bacterium]MBK8675820.1 glycosyltransferase family 4 protein [Cellvibrionales bacterium]
MNFLQLALVLFAAFSASACLCFLIVTRRKQIWLDHPNERSLHKAPVSRLGGIAIWLGVLCAVLLTRSELSDLLSIYHMIAALLLLFIALLDDGRGLHPASRFVAQAIAAVSLVWSESVYVSVAWLPWLWPIIGVVVLMWCTNLYNFMDGMDGFAGSMGAIGFATLAILGIAQEQIPFAIFSAIISASCVGFLCFNFPPARIFMGDSGSTVLGFFMGALSIQGWQLNLYPLWVPVLIFSPFWVDATVTLGLRLYRREKVWLAHRQHHYQRWVLAGYSHRQVLGWYIVLMLSCSFTAIIQQTVQHPLANIGLPLAWLVCYGSLILQSERKLRQVKVSGSVQ